MVRQEAVRPFVAATVTVAALEDGEAGSCRGLRPVLGRILAFADRHILPLCRIAREALGEASGGAEDGLQPDGAEAGSGSVLVETNFYIGSCLFAELSTVLLSVGGRRVTHYLVLPRPCPPCVWP